MYTLRYRDSIGRWTMAVLSAQSLNHALALAAIRYGSYRDLHAL